VRNSGLCIPFPQIYPTRHQPTSSLLNHSPGFFGVEVVDDEPKLL
jgi:hypothetical protein